MGRHKTIKLPFLKLKLKSGTIYSIFALLFILFFALSVFSFKRDALALQSLNEWLLFYFGKGAFFFPIIFLFAAGLMLQSKRMRFMRPNWFAGYILVFFSYITLFNTGFIGETINAQTSEFLSVPGTAVTFLIMLLTGIFIIFEVSLQEVVKALGTLFAKLKKSMKIMQDKAWAQREVEDKLKGKKGEDLFVGAGKKFELPANTPSSVGALDKKTMGSSVAPLDGLLKPLPTLRAAAGQNWKFPQLSLLGKAKEADADRGDIRKNAHAIEEALESFGIKARVADINYGPAVTQYALQIAKGVKLNKVTSLSNNLALALAAPSGQIRIEAPIPGKSLIGIEVPNVRSQVVTLLNMLKSPLYVDRSRPLMVPLGLDVAGAPVSVEINKMPHILVAGTTGSGKSVMLSSWIATLLFRTTPEELKLILIDPKRVTFMMFENIPHLLTNVITDPKESLSALKWAVKEMENRYKLLSDARTRDVHTYNEQRKEGVERMSYVCIFIDELADLMMSASKEVEDTITRIAQKARAVGIYLIIATQRPSVDVITGLMKANIPARIAFNVSSMIDSRVILDMPGAEKLLGRGDMLFLSPDQAKPRRIQGPFLTDEEIKGLVDFLKINSPVVHYTEEVTQQSVRSVTDHNGNVTFRSSSRDPLFPDAVMLVCSARKAASSLLQRKFSIGYSRAARILDELEEAGVVGKQEGSKPRELLIQDPLQILNQQAN